MIGPYASDVLPMRVDLQALYPRLIHLMLDTVFVVDRDNQIVFISDACPSVDTRKFTHRGTTMHDPESTLLDSWQHTPGPGSTPCAVAPSRAVGKLPTRPFC